MSKPPVEAGVGIDLGTTETAISIHSGRNKLHMACPNNGQQLASVVYTNADGKRLFGRAALNASCRDPDGLAVHFKRGMPTQPRDPWNGGSTPIELTTFLLQYIWSVILKVRSDIKAYIPELGGKSDPDLLQIAVTHPATYNLEAIRNLEEAISNVGDGFRADLLMPEPVAMAQVYREERSDRIQTNDLMAVLDLGGGTYDACILKSLRGVLDQRVGGKGSESLGGLNLTGELFLHAGRILDLPAVSAYDPQRGLCLAAAPSAKRQDLAELWAKCDDAKKSLSLDTETTVYVQTSAGLKELTLRRDEAVSLWEPLFDRLAAATVDVVEGTPYDWKDVPHILVGGGSALAPGVADCIAGAIGRDVADVFVYGDPTHMVSDGAAYQARMKEHASVCLPGGLGFELADPRTGGSIYKFVFGSGEPVPIDGRPVESTGHYVESNGTPATLQVTLVEAKVGVHVPRPNGTQVLLTEDEILPIASISNRIDLPEGRHDVRFGFYHTPEKQLRYRILVLDGDTDLVDGVVKKDDSSIGEVGAAFDLVLLLDCSSSMSGNKIDQAKAAVRYLLTLIAPLDVRVAFIPFGKQTQLLCPLGSDLAIVDRKLDAVAAAGSTPMDRGEKIALDHIKAEESHRDVLTVLVTDGWPDDMEPAESIAGEIRQLGELVSIGIGEGVAADFLTRIATSPQHYFYCDDVSTLASIFEQVAELHLDLQEASS